MTDRWFIVADDLTGAADCAVAFASRGFGSTLIWSNAVVGDRVVAYNVDSRAMTSYDAAARHRQVLEHGFEPGTRVFKKIDSTLRGHPAVEIAATAGAIRKRTGSAFGICAPAFPAARRTTEQGIVHVDRKPLDGSADWRRGRQVRSANLCEVLADAGIDSELVPLDAIRADSITLKSRIGSIASRGIAIAVCDAVEQEDLERIVAAAVPFDEATFFIGTAGLANALARSLPVNQREPIAVGALPGGSLIVVGSPAPVSQAAAAVCSRGGMRHERIDVCHLAGETPAPAATLAVKRSVDALQAGDNVVIEMTGDRLDPSIAPRLAANLAHALQPAARHINALVVTGGETAAALLSRFGVEGIRLIDEIEPGVCLGQTLGDLTIPIVTKSGAFGDEQTLLRATHRLHQIKTSRVFA